MAQGRIIYDVPRYRRWRILVAASTAVGIVAALPLWGYGHLAGAPAREGVVLKPVSQGAALSHEIAADPFGVRDWPAGPGPVAAEPPAAPSSTLQQAPTGQDQSVFLQPAHAAASASYGARAPAGVAAGSQDVQGIARPRIPQ